MGSNLNSYLSLKDKGNKTVLSLTTWTVNLPLHVLYFCVLKALCQSRWLKVSGIWMSNNSSSSVSVVTTMQLE